MYLMTSIAQCSFYKVFLCRSVKSVNSQACIPTVRNSKSNARFSSLLVSVKDPRDLLISPAELRVDRRTKNAGVDADVWGGEAHAAETICIYGLLLCSNNKSTYSR